MWSWHVRDSNSWPLQKCINADKLMKFQFSSKIQKSWPFKFFNSGKRVISGHRVNMRVGSPQTNVCPISDLSCSIYYCTRLLTSENSFLPLPWRRSATPARGPPWSDPLPRTARSRPRRSPGCACKGWRVTSLCSSTGARFRRKNMVPKMVPKMITKLVWRLLRSIEKRAYFLN